jgi:hypothetical protein
MNTDDFRGLQDVRPTVMDNGVPMCATYDCPSYDGKRCRVMGFRPSTICEPGVIELARLADLKAVKQPEEK